MAQSMNIEHISRITYDFELLSMSGSPDSAIETPKIGRRSKSDI
jgi:hypothetical protein